MAQAGITIINNLVALVGGGIAAYALWYRFNVGPWCIAMWFGSAPLLIIAVTFVAIRRLLTSYYRQQGQLRNTR